MKKLVLFHTGLGVLCAGMFVMSLPAFAGDAPSKDSDKTSVLTHRNEQYDTNKDGKLDEQERAAMKADRAAKRQARLLAKYDVNKNGQLDPDEQAKCDADREARRLKAAERRKAKAAEKAAAAPATSPAVAVTPSAPAEDDDEDDIENHKH